MNAPSKPPHKSIYADDPLMTPLIADFTKNLSGQVADIRRAIAKEDAAALQRICHQLKGSGKSYGFAPISTHAADAEEKLKNRKPLMKSFMETFFLILDNFLNELLLGINLRVKVIHDFTYDRH